MNQFNSREPLFYIYAASANSWSVRDEIPSLKAQLSQQWGKSIRRINHFIELALFGAKQCVDKAAVPLAGDCTVLLTTEHGAVNEVAGITDQMLRMQQSPMPFEFMNVTSNMAAFHVAQQLTLDGRNMTLSHRQFPVETCLEFAGFDLQTKEAQQVLVGCVDECAVPLEVHRRRLGLAKDAPLAEGSHWLMIGASPQTAIGQCDGIEHYPDRKALVDALSGEDLLRNGRTALSGMLDPAELAKLQHETGTPAEAVIAPPPWPQKTHAAHTIASFFETAQRHDGLVHISQSADGKYVLMRFR